MKTILNGFEANVENLSLEIMEIEKFEYKYKPSPKELALSNLKELKTKGDLAVAAVKNAKVAYKSASTLYETALDEFNPLFTSINNLIRIGGASSEIIETITNYVKISRGLNIIPTPKPIVTPPKSTTTPIAPQISETQVASTTSAPTPTPTPAVIKHKNHYLFLSKRVSNIDSMIKTLASEPTYNPSEEAVTINGLTNRLNNLKILQTNAQNAFVTLEKMRSDRNTLFNTIQNGIVDAGQNTKLYIKATFGVNSPEYKAVKKIKFRKIDN